MLPAVLCALALGACATTLSADARKLQHIDAPSAGGCESLGLVEGSSSLSGVSRGTGMANAVHEMYETAAALGATHVAYSERKGSYWTTAQHVQGNAYRCPAGYDGARSRTGCARDTDCKGERVCVAGACVDPQH